SGSVCEACSTSSNATPRRLEGWNRFPLPGQRRASSEASSSLAKFGDPPAYYSRVLDNPRIADPRNSRRDTRLFATRAPASTTPQEMGRPVDETRRFVRG